MYLLRTSRLGRRRYLLRICKFFFFIYVYKHVFFPRFGFDVVFTELGFDGTMYIVPVGLIGNGGALLILLNFFVFLFWVCLFCSFHFELLEMFVGSNYLGELLISRVNFQYLATWVSLF